MGATAMARSSLAHHWTPDEEALLEQLLVEGKDLRVIAVRLKRSIPVVQHQAGRLRARSARRELRALQPKPEPRADKAASE